MERISLELKQLSCRDLKAFNFFQKLSVYTVVYLVSEEVKKQKPQKRYMQQQRQKTPVDREGGSSPEWNHAVKFDLNNGPYPCNGDHFFLKFQLRCKGVIFRNRNIGEVYVPLKDLFKESNGNARFVSYQVRNLNGKPNGVLSFSYKVKGEAKVKRIDTSAGGFPSGVHFPPEKIHHQPVEVEVKSPKTCFHPSLGKLRSPPPATRHFYSNYPSLRTDVPSPNGFYSCPVGDIYTSVTMPPPTIPMQLATLAAGHRFPAQQYQSPLLPPPSAGFGCCRREAMDSDMVYMGNHGV